MKNVLLHASKNEIVDILDVTSEKCALSISCQMFQLENGSALLVDSKINNFSNTSRQRIGRSCQCPPNLTSLQRNKIWWHNWACFFGLQKLLLYDDSCIDSCLYLQLIEWSVFCNKGVVELNDSFSFSQGFIFSKLIWEISEIKLQVVYT